MVYLHEVQGWLKFFFHFQEKPHEFNPLYKVMHYEELQGSQVTLEQSEYEKSNSTDETLWQA